MDGYFDEWRIDKNTELDWEGLEGSIWDHNKHRRLEMYWGKRINIIR